MNREVIRSRLPKAKGKKAKSSPHTSPIPKQGQHRQRAARRARVNQYIGVARNATIIQQKVSMPGRPEGAKAETVFELLKFKYKT